MHFCPHMPCAEPNQELQTELGGSIYDDKKMVARLLEAFY